MPTPENIRRLLVISSKARYDGICGEEYVRRIIQRAVLAENPLISPEDDFIVLGIDGLDESIFPCGSFKTFEEAEFLVRAKTEEESFFSDNEDASTTFHVFTKDGFHVPLKDTSRPQ